MAVSQVAARQFREVEAPPCETLGLHRSGKSADYGKKNIRDELDKIKEIGGWTARPRQNQISLTEMEKIIKSNSISPARVLNVPDALLNIAQP